MAKQIIKYKVIRQSAEMGAKFYGVVNNADPISAELTMEQIIDKRKLHNYSAKQLTVLMEEVLQGAAELVARDGMPRNLSTLLKFEARIRGTFANTESGITDQTVLVKPRMLKDIKVDINKSDFTFVNESGDTSPRISGLALESPDFTGWDTSVLVESQETGWRFIGDLTVSGLRLAVNGWGADCKWSFAIVRGDTILRLDHTTSLSSEDVQNYGFLRRQPTVSSDNVITFTNTEDVPIFACWRANTLDPTVPHREAAYNGAESGETLSALQAGDRVVFSFARDLGDGSGSVVMASKEYVIA